MSRAAAATGAWPGGLGHVDAAAVDKGVMAVSTDPDSETISLGAGPGAALLGAGGEGRGLW